MDVHCLTKVATPSPELIMSSRGSCIDDSCGFNIVSSTESDGDVSTEGPHGKRDREDHKGGKKSNKISIPNDKIKINDASPSSESHKKDKQTKASLKLKSSTSEPDESPLNFNVPLRTTPYVEPVFKIVPVRKLPTFIIRGDNGQTKLVDPSTPVTEVEGQHKIPSRIKKVDGVMEDLVTQKNTPPIDKQEEFEYLGRGVYTPGRAGFQLNAGEEERRSKSHGDPESLGWYPIPNVRTPMPASPSAISRVADSKSHNVGEPLMSDGAQWHTAQQYPFTAPLPDQECISPIYAQPVWGPTMAGSGIWDPGPRPNIPFNPEDAKPSLVSTRGRHLSGTASVPAANPYTLASEHVSSSYKSKISLAGPGYSSNKAQQTRSAHSTPNIGPVIPPRRHTNKHASSSSASTVHLGNAYSRPASNAAASTYGAPQDRRQDGLALAEPTRVSRNSQRLQTMTPYELNNIFDTKIMSPVSAVVSRRSIEPERWLSSSPESHNSQPRVSASAKMQRDIPEVLPIASQRSLRGAAFTAEPPKSSTITENHACVPSRQQSSASNALPKMTHGSLKSILKVNHDVYASPRSSANATVDYEAMNRSSPRHTDRRSSFQAASQSHKPMGRSSNSPPLIMADVQPDSMAIRPMHNYHDANSFRSGTQAQNPHFLPLPEIDTWISPSPPPVDNWHAPLASLHPRDSASQVFSHVDLQPNHGHPPSAGAYTSSRRKASIATEKSPSVVTLLSNYRAPTAEDEHSDSAKDELVENNARQVNITITKTKEEDQSQTPGSSSWAKSGLFEKQASELSTKSCLPHHSTTSQKSSDVRHLQGSTSLSASHKSILPQSSHGSQMPNDFGRAASVQGSYNAVTEGVEVAYGSGSFRMVHPSTARSPRRPERRHCSC